MLVTATTNSHWYLRKEDRWEPFYECPRKGGGGTKSVTLREAREFKAVPSVTNVLNVLAKPGLEAWKATQYIEAALTLPKLPNEPLDAYARRVVEDAETRSAKARDFGSRIHKAIEQNLTQAIAPLDPDIEPFIAPIQDWLNKNILDIHGAEIIVGSQELGYAGRLDLDCNYVETGRAVIDFKTQGVKNGKPAFYREWAKQLAAYQHTRDRFPSIVSVVIDSTTPREPFVHVWDNSDHHFEMFRYCLELWQDERGYYPQNA